MEDIEQNIEQNLNEILVKKEVKEKNVFFSKNTWTNIKYTVAIFGLFGILALLLFLLYYYL